MDQINLNSKPTVRGAQDGCSKWVSVFDMDPKALKAARAALPDAEIAAYARGKQRGNDRPAFETDRI